MLDPQVAGRILGSLNQPALRAGEVPVSPLPVGGAESGRKRPWEQRATLRPRVCSRPRCGRAFQPRLTGGHPQEFCSPGCRFQFTNECRRAARARAKRTPRRTRRPEYWLSGIDVATGRRMAVAIRTLEDLPRPSLTPSMRSADRDDGGSEGS